MNILCVGDAHVTNGQDLSRFHVLSRFILEYKPDTVVLMGDFLTLNALSAWDRNKRAKMEGRRYHKEIEAGNNALDYTTACMEEYNRARRKNRKRTYTPRIVYLEGNHEDRLTRYLESDPTFAGHVSVQKDLKLEERNITWIPYRSYYWENDIGFTHIPFTKSREISGVDITRKAAGVTVKSTVFGHTHELHCANVHKVGQPHLQQVLSTGCWFEDTEEYALGRVTQYWKGLCLLDSWKPGRFDLQTFALSKLRREYGIPRAN